jgi:hypothetical protein
MNRAVLAAATLLAAGVAPACGTVGPPSVGRDRVGYSAALADSWKELTLLNIVKLRYADVPVFVDVSSIVAGYTLETSINAGATFYDIATVADQGTFGGRGTLTDRPTITYVPMTGEKFLRGMIDPIRPANAVSLIQMGYPADFILALTTSSVNGHRNWAADMSGVREPDPQFVHLAGLLREIQKSGRIGMRLETMPDGKSTEVLFLRADGAEPEIAQAIAEAEELLGVQTGRHKYRLVYGAVRGGDDELVIGTKSLLQVMSTLSAFVEVPASDVDEGRASAAQAPGDPTKWPLIVRSGPHRPARGECYASVHYRDAWYWIEDRDLRSKRSFGVIMFLFTLVDTGGSGQTPLLTISTQ